MLIDPEIDDRALADMLTGMLVDTLAEMLPGTLTDTLTGTLVVDTLADTVTGTLIGTLVADTLTDTVLAGTVVEMTAEKEFAVETEMCFTCWAVRFAGLSERQLQLTRYKQDQKL